MASCPIQYTSGSNDINHMLNSIPNINRWTLWKGLVGRLHGGCGQAIPTIGDEAAAYVASFPKFGALRAYLEERCERELEFHGMIFVRTRLVSSNDAANTSDYRSDIRPSSFLAELSLFIRG